MFCRRCGNEILENEKFCSRCGAEVQVPESMVQPEAIVQPESAVQPEITVPVQPEAIVQPEPIVQPQSMVQPQNVVQPGNAMGNVPYGNTMFVQPEPGVVTKKPKSKKATLFIIGAVVLLLLVLIVLNLERITNFVYKTFKSPEEYYQYVEKETVSELAALGGELYQTYIYERMNSYDKSEGIELAVELQEDGEEFLEMAGFAGVDLSWIQGIKIGLNTSVKDDVYSIGFTTNLNSDDIISGNIIMDMGGEAFYLQFPELTKTYMGYDLGEEIDSSYQAEELEQLKENGEYSKALLQVMPSQAEVEKLIEKYISIALSCIDDVDKKGNKTLKVESIQQNCTELKVTIDADTLEDILNAILNEALNDKELERIIIDVVDQVELEDVDGEEAYEAFVEEIEYMLDDIEYYYDEDVEVVMKVFVDGKGDIRGRKIECVDHYYDETTTINILMPEKGNNYEFELSAESYGDEIKFAGNGKKTGNKLSGEFQARYNGASVVEVAVEELDTKELKLGRLNGNFEIAPSSKIMDVVGDVSGASIIKDFKLILDTSMEKNVNAFAVDIIYEEEELGSIALSFKTGNASKISIPNSTNTILIEDGDSVIEWLESVDWDKLADRLAKTDLPSDVIDIIEEMGEAVDEDEIEEFLYELMYMY